MEKKYGAIMRIVMPLFWFHLKDANTYLFDDAGEISIVPFEKSEIPKIPLFSEQDLHHMANNAHWALIYDGPDIERGKTKVNILLLAFRIFCHKRYPFIEYRLCSEDHHLCSILSETIAYNYFYPRSPEPFNTTDLYHIKRVFLSLIEMDQISVRTHNALYFLYRAWHTTKWMDSFIFMMCSLESLFSKDKPGSATKTISIRVSSLLDSKPKRTKEDIENLYDLRSEMTHGKIKASDDPGENMKKLYHLDSIVIECFRIMVDLKLYREYSSKCSRDRLMSTLNTSV